MVSFPKVMGHRGAASLAPENTLPSVRKAADCGLNWIEFDVKLTGEGTTVLFHDDALARTTGKTGIMAELSTKEALTLDAGGWFSSDFAGVPVPSFRATIELALELGLSINVEVKPSEGLAQETAERALGELAELWPQSGGPDVVISSFQRPCLEVAQRDFPQWPRALIVDQLPADWDEALEAYACESFHLYHGLMTPDLVAAIKAGGRAIACYTVNEAGRARELFDMGVDCVITDDPPAILAVLED